MFNLENINKAFTVKSNEKGFYIITSPFKYVNSSKLISVIVYEENGKATVSDNGELMHILTEFLSPIKASKLISDLSLTFNVNPSVNEIIIKNIPFDEVNSATEFICSLATYLSAYALTLSETNQ